MTRKGLRKWVILRHCHSIFCFLSAYQTIVSVGKYHFRFAAVWLLEAAADFLVTTRSCPETQRQKLCGGLWYCMVFLFPKTQTI